MAKNYRLVSALALGALVSLTTIANATVYVFTVTCPANNKVVEQWTTETVDPGKDFLKAKTEEKHPGCKASDYKKESDAKFLKNTQYYSVAPEGQSGDGGIPVVGSAVGGVKKAFCGFLNC
jgi:hypothetical protein